MAQGTTAKSGKPIRLPDERWTHIITRHPRMSEMQELMLDTVRSPDRIVLGEDGEHLALREIQPGKHLVVVYREFEDDGFIITAFTTRQLTRINRRPQLWP